MCFSSLGAPFAQNASVLEPFQQLISSTKCGLGDCQVARWTALWRAQLFPPPFTLRGETVWIFLLSSFTD